MKFVVADLDDVSAFMGEHLRSFMPDDMDIEYDYAVYLKDGEEEFFRKCEDADIIVPGYFQWDEPQLARLKNCKGISVPATGYNTVDVEAAARMGIPVTNVHEYCTDEVSYHTIMLMMALQRGLPWYEKSVREDKEWKYDAYTQQKVIRDQVLGICGLGKIGKAVAKKAMGIGMKVIAYDPYIPSEEGEAIGVTMMDTKEDVLKNCDVLTLHMTLTEETTDYINDAEFDLMANKPIVLNCARGPMINEEALIRALDEGKICAAGLDVLVSEAPDMKTHPLNGRDNVILTPHAAFFSEQSLEKMDRIAAENAVNLYLGNYDKTFKIVNGFQE